MILIKSKEEIKVLREGGQILAMVIDEISAMVTPGITTKEIENKAHDLIIKMGAKPGFLGYNGFPSSICTSVNSQLVHGIPTDNPLKEGDILSIDLGVLFKGFNTDSAVTLPVGNISSENKRLLEATKGSLFNGLKVVKDGARLGDLSFAIQDYIETKGFSVVRDLVGHGIGRDLHEEPQIPNFGTPGSGPVLKSGMVLAIEPMVSMGSFEIEVDNDDWTVVMADKSMSAHFEHTVVVTDNGYEILTLSQKS